MHPSPVSDLLPSSHDCAVSTQVQDIYGILQLEDQQTLRKNVSRGRKPLGVNMVLSCCTNNRVPLPPFGSRQMSPRLHQGATYVNTLLTAPHLDASRHIGQLHRDSKPPQAWKGAKISPLHALGGSVSTGNPVHAWLRCHKQITP